MTEQVEWHADEWIELTVLSDIVSLAQSLKGGQTAGQQAGDQVDGYPGLQTAGKSYKKVDESQCFKNQLSTDQAYNFALVTKSWLENKDATNCILITTMSQLQSEGRDRILSDMQLYGLHGNLVLCKNRQILWKVNSSKEVMSFINKFRSADEKGLSIELSAVRAAYIWEKFYPIFVQLKFTSSLHGDVTKDFQNVFRKFGGRVSLQLTDYPQTDQELEPTTPDLAAPLPRVFMLLQFNLSLEQSRKRHNALQESLDKETCWKKLERGIHQISSTQIYIHEKRPHVGIGFTIGPADGLTIYLNTSSADMFTESEIFYKNLLKSDKQSSSNEYGSQLKIPIGRYLEFVVRYHKEYQPRAASDDLSIHLTSVQTSQHSDIIQTETDPDGNQISIHTLIN